jgi:hypothetical protein
MCYPSRVNAVRTTATAALLAGWALGAVAPASLAAEEANQAAKKAAAAHFRAGEEAFRKHRYADAADAFEMAYKVVPHPAPLSNAVDARVKAGQNARAAELCALLLRELGPDGGEREGAERRLSELLPKVGRLSLEGEGAFAISVDGAPAALGLRYVEPGDHLVRARAAGEAIERRVSVPAGAIQRVVLDPLAAPAPARAPGDAPRPLGGVTQIEVTAPESAPPAKPLSPAWFFVGLGATATAGGLALWSGLDTLAARDDFDRDPTPDKLERGRDKQVRTNVLLAATGGFALATGAVALFATDWSGAPKRARAGASVRLAAGLGVVGVLGQF